MKRKSIQTNRKCTIFNLRGAVVRGAVVSLLICSMLVLAGCGKGAAQEPADSGSTTLTEQPEPEHHESEQPESEQPETELPESEQPAPAEESPSDEISFRAAFLKVGKADAIILQSGEETMVIDCGEEEDGQEVLDYLAEQGVTQVDVLLITHFDKDHVGGADTVVKGIEVKRVLQPAYEGVVDAYTDFEEALAEESIAPENVTETLDFDFGGAAVTVEPPASYEIPQGSGEYDNDFSLITTVECGAKRFVFAGDIEKKRIREWLAQGGVRPCDVLKVPHHGVYNAALGELFEALTPEIAVICDSKKNPADSRTLELLSKYSASILETKDGDVSILCDGENVWVQ